MSDTQRDRLNLRLEHPYQNLAANGSDRPQGDLASRLVCRVAIVHARQVMACVPQNIDNRIATRPLLEWQGAVKRMWPGAAAGREPLMCDEITPDKKDAKAEMKRKVLERAAKTISKLCEKVDAGTASGDEMVMLVDLIRVVAY